MWEVLVNKPLLEELQYGRYKINSCVSGTEIPLGDAGRADIIFGLKVSAPKYPSETISIVLIIENKVSSQEHSSQTKKYENVLFNQDQLASVMHDKLAFELRTNVKIIPVFLAPYVSDDIKEEISKVVTRPDTEKYINILPESGEFEILNYQYLMDGVLSPCEKTCKNQYCRTLIRDYIRCLGPQPLSDDIKSDDDSRAVASYLVMAISENEKQAAINFWKKYNGPIIKVLDSMKSVDTFLLDLREFSLWHAIAQILKHEITEHGGKDPDLESILERALNTPTKNGKRAEEPVDVFWEDYKDYEGVAWMKNYLEQCVSEGCDLKAYRRERSYDYFRLCNSEGKKLCDGVPYKTANWSIDFCFHDVESRQKQIDELPQLGREKDKCTLYAKAILTLSNVDEPTFKAIMENVKKSWGL